MPLRLGKGQNQVLACPGKSNENSGRRMHGSIQKSVMDAMVKKIAMDVSNQRTTNTVGNQKCHCATECQLSYFSRVDRCGTG